MEKQRKAYLDIAKGIGILLVVLGHSGIHSDYLIRAIYSFHMPFFFIVSGYLYSRSESIKDFVLKRVRSLYLPFVVVNIAGTIVYYLVFSETCFADGPIPFFKEILAVLLSLKHSPVMFGPTWFLAALFQVSIVYKVLDSSVRESKYTDIGLLILFIAFLYIGNHFYFVDIINYSFKYAFYYAVGVCLKRREYDFEKEGSLIYSLAWIVGALILEYFLHAASIQGIPLLVFGNVLVAISISIALIGVCVFIEKISFRPIRMISNAFSFLGKNTRSILIWHYVFFRIIMLVQMIIANDDFSIKSNFLIYFPVYSSEKCKWLIYVVVGIAGPLLFSFGLKRLFLFVRKTFLIKGICEKKTHEK